MKPVIFGTIMTLLACLGLAWLWQTNQSSQAVVTAPETTAVAPAPTQREVHQVIRDLPPTAALPQEPATKQPQPPAPPALVSAPPALDGSDEQTQKAVRDLSDTLLQWLTPSEQLRKWVILVDNLAMGKVPVKSRPFNVSIPAFKVTGSEQQPILAQENFARTTPIVNAFVKLEPTVLVRYFRAWSPLLNDAYAELGQPGEFSDRLIEAIDRVLEVQPLNDSIINLKQPAVYYTFADPEREQASDLEKLLWRMGPQNTVRIQSHLREIKLALARSPNN